MYCSIEVLYNKYIMIYQTEMHIGHVSSKRSSKIKFRVGLIL